LGLVPVDSKTDALNRDLATPRSTALLLNRVVITFLQKNYNWREERARDALLRQRDRSEADL